MPALSVLVFCTAVHFWNKNKGVNSMINSNYCDIFPFFQKHILYGLTHRIVWPGLKIILEVKIKE